MNIKKITLLLISLIVIGTLSGVMADNGTYKGENEVIINQSDENVTYNSVCIEEDNPIRPGDKVKTTPNITVRNGTIDVFIKDWTRDVLTNETTANKFQDKIWNVTENRSLPFIQYPDFYQYLRLIDSEKITAEELINGTLYNVTRWTTYSDLFTFRMTGDGWGKGQQDLLLYLVESDDIFNIFIDRNDTNDTPPVVINNTTNDTNDTPIIPVYPPTNTTNDTNETNKTLVKPESPNIEVNDGIKVSSDVVDLKPTGSAYWIVVVIAIVLICLGIVYVVSKRR